jgi:ubiquinone/menaquinone biosynthesis C-methylase UbiE
MTWEETIRFIRLQSEYKSLVAESYLDENLRLNVERFHASPEFIETLRIVKAFAPGAKNILDVGAGNGISSLAFALNGYYVTAAEPDQSNTVGSAAIEQLKEEFNMGNVSVLNAYGEDLPVANESFDVVYIRQAMHHAADLNAFIREAVRVLKPGGLLLTVRDHVIFGTKDKLTFLQSHPLQKFYGGENAFTPAEYKAAFKNAGVEIKEHLKFSESVINYFPESEDAMKNFGARMKKNFQLSIQKRFGSWAVNFPFLQMLELISIMRNGDWNDERRVPGRMHSFIALKNSQ